MDNNYFLKQLSEYLTANSFLYLFEILMVVALIFFFKKLGLRLFIICLFFMVLITSIDIYYVITGKTLSAYIFQILIHFLIVSSAFSVRFLIDKLKFRLRKFTYV